MGVRLRADALVASAVQVSAGGATTQQQQQQQQSNCSIVTKIAGFYLALRLG